MRFKKILFAKVCRTFNEELCKAEKDDTYGPFFINYFGGVLLNKGFLISIAMYLIRGFCLP